MIPNRNDFYSEIVGYLQYFKVIRSEKEVNRLTLL